MKLSKLEFGSLHSSCCSSALALAGKAAGSWLKLSTQWGEGSGGEPWQRWWINREQVEGVWGTPKSLLHLTRRGHAAPWAPGSILKGLGDQGGAGWCLAGWVVAVCVQAVTPLSPFCH